VRFQQKAEVEREESINEEFDESRLF
jgi:hypothetical protein